MRWLSLSTILLFVLSNLLFAGRYYDAATGRFLQIDPHSSKYPSVSPYNYTLNNPLKNIDPDGKDVLDAITGKPLTVTEMTSRTKNLITQMNSSSKGIFASNVITTHSNFREDLYQIWGGRQVDWGGTMGFTFFGTQTGYPRYTMNTMFTLNNENINAGWTTQMTASPSLQLNPALSNDYNQNIYNLSFGATTFDAEGNSVHSDYVIIITGTIAEINFALAGTGYELYKNDKGKYIFRQIVEDKEEDEKEKNDE